MASEATISRLTASISRLEARINHSDFLLISFADQLKCESQLSELVKTLADSETSIGKATSSSESEFITPPNPSRSRSCLTPSSGPGAQSSFPGLQRKPVKLFPADAHAQQKVRGTGNIQIHQNIHNHGYVNLDSSCSTNPDSRTKHTPQRNRDTSRYAT
jgi:hypothetical protein